MLQLRHSVRWHEFAEVISDGLVIIKGWKQPMVSIPLSNKLDHLFISAVMTMRFLYFNTNPVFPQNLAKKRWKWPVLYFMVPVGPDLLVPGHAPVKICYKYLIFDAPAGLGSSFSHRATWETYKEIQLSKTEFSSAYNSPCFSCGPLGKTFVLTLRFSQLLSNKNLLYFIIWCFQFEFAGVRSL